MKPRLVCTVLSGQTGNEKKTREIAKAFRNCPYTYFMATKGNKLFAVMNLTPERANIWTENQKKTPDAIFGLEKAQVTLVDNVQHPAELELRLPKEPQQKTPCGLNCSNCPAYAKCSGCPATIYYKK